MREALLILDEASSEASNDFLDGIIFSQDCGVICSGRLTDQIGPRVQRFSRPKDPWFYLHARDVVRDCATTSSIELVPLVDYLFRYDRGAF